MTFHVVRADRIGVGTTGVISGQFKLTDQSQYQLAVSRGWGRALDGHLHRW